MFIYDDKNLAIIALMVIAIIVLWATGHKGLGVVSNIVCGLVGFVTGSAITKEEKGGLPK